MVYRKMYIISSQVTSLARFYRDGIFLNLIPIHKQFFNLIKIKKSAFSTQYSSMNKKTDAFESTFEFLIFNRYLKP